MNYVETNPALVFNCHYNGLSIIQSLGRHGVQVYALDNVRSVGTHSRYSKFWCCPDPIVSENAFITYLLEKAKTFASKPVLFPTNDHWAMAISKHKKLLQQYYIPCVADWETVEILVYKDQFYPWAIKHKYPVPLLYTKDELLIADFTIFPVIAKPKYRRIPNLPQSGFPASPGRVWRRNRSRGLQCGVRLHCAAGGLPMWSCPRRGIRR